MDCNPQGEGDYNMPRFKQSGPKVAPGPQFKILARLSGHSQSRTDYFTR